MKQKKILPLTLLALATSLGFASASFAADAAGAAPVPASGSMGLLGQTYAGLSYSYDNLHASPVHADDYAFEYNQPLAPGLDALFNYDFTQAGLFLGDRANDQRLKGALRAFSTSMSWGKPYVEAGAGYEWTKAYGVRDNSFAWHLAAGVEFQVAPALTITPYVKYQDAPDLTNASVWKYGVRANYWVDRQWAVTAGIERNTDLDMKYTVGTSFRF